jgi:hypothetical protein
MILLFAFLIVYGHTSESHSDHEDEAEHTHDNGEEVLGPNNPNVGPKKGVVEASHDLGFKLSEAALRNFKIETVVPPSQYSLSSLPRSAKVSSADSTEVFRLRSGYFKRSSFRAENFREAGDRLVVSGAAFLRVVELDLESGSSHGHSH